MALFAKEVRSNDRAIAAQEKQLDIFQRDPNSLNQNEIAFLLEILKRSSFTGEQIELVYNLVVKLQNQYIQQKNG